jgi:hypothetical protein
MDKDGMADTMSVGCLAEKLPLVSAGGGYLVDGDSDSDGKPGPVSNAHNPTS